jgi:hypothetical protein
MAKSEEYTKAEQQWITETRLRLAQRRGKKPATKSGQIRALWPEIRTAIADGQSLASIRQWLEEEGGVIVTVQSLGSYLTRIRRKEKATAATRTPPLDQPRSTVISRFDRVSLFDSRRRASENLRQRNQRKNWLVLGRRDRDPAWGRRERH